MSVMVLLLYTSALSLIAHNNTNTDSNIIQSNPMLSMVNKYIHIYTIQLAPQREIYFSQKISSKSTYLKKYTLQL